MKLALFPLSAHLLPGGIMPLRIFEELPHNNKNAIETVSKTIQQTGLSIIYTSLVLIAGFVIFCASSFGGTFALGWLTSLTLLIATITNLVLLPVLLVAKKK